MLHSQDNLHSGPLSPVSLSASDITTLLPCDEDDFAQARQPASRAALDGTQPARENPALVSDKNRSLFASLMQIHHLWGIVGRHAVTFSRSPNPWDCNSQFSKMVTKLSEWEASLPAKHLYSDELLRSYKADGEDLVSLTTADLRRAETNTIQGLLVCNHDDKTMQHCPPTAISSRVSLQLPCPSTYSD